MVASTYGSPNYNGDGASLVYGCGAQLELASTPGKYTATTSAAVYSQYFALPVEYNASAVAQGILVEEARTNIALYARDCSNAAWTKTNVTAAYTATGVGNVANTASTLTASATNGTCQQYLTSTSAARLFSAFVKRRTGTGSIFMTQGATTGSTLITVGDFATDTVWAKGTGWTIAAGVATATAAAVGQKLTQSGVSVTSGKLYAVQYTVSGYSAGSVSAEFNNGGTQGTARSANGTYTDYFYATSTGSITIGMIPRVSALTANIDDVSVFEVVETDITSSVTSDWTRIAVPVATITNPQVGFRIATSGDAIDVDYCQSEAGAFGPTSPIVTGSANVTRAGDNPLTALAGVMPALGSEYTVYFKMVGTTPLADANSFRALAVNDGTANERIEGYINTTFGGFTVHDGGVLQASLDVAGSRPAVATVVKGAARIKLNDCRSAANGTLSAQDTSVTLPTVTQLQVGRNHGGGQANGYIQQIMLLPVAKLDAELQTLTT
jgi:hypothetical protein